MRLILSLLFLNFYSICFGQFQPTDNLFSIKRSKDADRVYYTVNLNDQGNLSRVDPIEIHWIRHEKDDRKEPLTWIQENFSYGLNYLSFSEDSVEFQFVSYRKQKLILLKNQDHYTVLMKTDYGLVELKEIFVQIDEGSFMLPSIPFVKITACEPDSDQLITQIITP